MPQKSPEVISAGSGIKIWKLRMVERCPQDVEENQLILKELALLAGHQQVPNAPKFEHIVWLPLTKAVRVL